MAPRTPAVQKTSVTAFAREVDAARASAENPVAVLHARLRRAMDAACAVPADARDVFWADEVARALRRAVDAAPPSLAEAAAAASVAYTLAAWPPFGAAVPPCDDATLIARTGDASLDDDAARAILCRLDLVSLPVWLAIAAHGGTDVLAGRLNLVCLRPGSPDDAAQLAGCPPSSWRTLQNLTAIRADDVLAVLLRRVIGAEKAVLRMLRVPGWPGANLPNGEPPAWRAVAPVHPPPPERVAAGQTKRALAIDAAARASVREMLCNRAIAVADSLLRERGTDLLKCAATAFDAVFGDGAAAAANALPDGHRALLAASCGDEELAGACSATVAYLNGVAAHGSATLAAAALLAPEAVTTTLVDSAIAFGGGDEVPPGVMEALRTLPFLLDVMHAALAQSAGRLRGETDVLCEDDEAMRQSGMRALGMLARALIKDVAPASKIYERLAAPLLLESSAAEPRLVGLEVLHACLDAGIGWWQSHAGVPSPGVACLRAMTDGTPEVFDAGARLLALPRTRTREAEGSDPMAADAVTALPWAVQLAVPTNLFPPGVFALPQPLLPPAPQPLPPLPPPPSPGKDTAAARAMRREYADQVCSVISWLFAFIASGDRAAATVAAEPEGLSSQRPHPGDAAAHALLLALRGVPRSMQLACHVRVLATWLPLQSAPRARRVLSVALPALIGGDAAAADLALRVAAATRNAVTLRHAVAAAAEAEATKM